MGSEEQPELPAWRAFRVAAVARYVCAPIDTGSMLVSPVPPERPHVLTLGEWAKTWMVEIQRLEAAGILRNQTYKAYETVVRKHWGALLGTPLDELRRPLLLEWARGQIAAGCSRKSLVLRVAVLKVCLRDAIGEGHIEANHAERLISSLRLPKAPRVVRWFEGADAAARFAAEADGGPEWVGIAVMLYTGIRLGEALGLQWDDVDLDAGRAVIRRQVSPSGRIGSPKSESGERFVDLPEVLVDVLRKARSEAGLRSPWVLGAVPEHNSAGRARIRKAMKDALKRAGLPHLTPHGLRHSWISFRGLLGHDARVIQGQAGHSHPEMTAHYSHLQRSDRKAVDEAADLIRPRQSRLFGKSEAGSK